MASSHCVGNDGPKGEVGNQAIMLDRELSIIRMAFGGKGRGNDQKLAIFIGLRQLRGKRNYLIPLPDQINKVLLESQQ